jgi:hypothetical protein
MVRGIVGEYFPGGDTQQVLKPFYIRCLIEKLTCNIQWCYLKGGKDGIAALKAGAETMRDDER